MSEEKTYTQADIDKLAASVEALEAKNAELVGDVRKAKQAARAASEIKPEDMAAVEAERDKALADLASLNKTVATLTKERDTATKALETEQGAARSYALEAEIASAIAEGNIVPALVPAFKAMIAQGAKADLVDGKYAVTIGDKPARDHIKALLDSEEGKAFRAAPMNGGGGSQGGGGAGGAAKTMDRDSFGKLKPQEQSTFVKEGGKITESAAA